MAGEPILIVDDTPVNLKLTRILLMNEGYRVLTASSAEEALEVMRGFHPELVLADIQLPGMNGLELTRRIKSDPNTQNIRVVALTASARKGDEQRALDAGCDGYLTKPIDSRTLGEQVRQYLDRRSESTSPTAPHESGGMGDLLSTDEMVALRRRFLDEGREPARKILADLDGAFDASVAARYVHQWIGAAGLLGLGDISHLSREVETLLRERPMDTGQVRESLTNLMLAFSGPREDAPEAPGPKGKSRDKAARG